MIERVEEPVHIEQPVVNIPEAPSKEQSKFTNARLSKYRKNIESIIENSSENEIAKKALAFLPIQNPTLDKYTELIQEILKNKTDKKKGVQGLGAELKRELVSVITRHYLDRVVFSGKVADRLNEMEPVLNQLRKQKIDTFPILEDWNLDEVSKAWPNTDLNVVKSVFSKK
ncbi:MAG: hypothetical protein C5B52_17450 [Bacteroidetes bacterium]|nr:MAG: hypothetical protein C5B52_17450 [Bacteroidota bacterium]